MNAKEEYFFKFIIVFICLTSLSACSSFSPEQNEMVTLAPSEHNGLQAQYFGASTILISDDQSSIMIDGFFTRQGLGKQLLSDLKTVPTIVDSSLKKSSIDEVDVLLVSHSHFDHLLDSVYVSYKTSAKLMGSQSTRDIVENEIDTAVGPKVNIDIYPIIANKEFPVNSFKVTPYKSKHGKKSFKARIGESFFLWKTNGQKYTDEGDVYSFYIEHESLNILVIPSASAETDKPYPKNVDLVFLSIGLLGSVCDDEIKEYWRKAVVETGAKVVIPIHYDNLYKPLKENIEAIPQWIDDVKGTVELIKRLAKSDPNNEINIYFPIPNKPFLLHSQ